MPLTKVTRNGQVTLPGRNYSLPSRDQSPTLRKALHRAKKPSVGKLSRSRSPVLREIPSHMLPTRPIRAPERPAE